MKKPSALVWLVLAGLACSSNTDSNPGAGGAGGAGGLGQSSASQTSNSSSSSSSASSSASSGGGGFGGAPLCPTYVPYLLGCSPSSCGNGFIDSCFESSYESCDSGDLGGQSCTSLGFSGGTLGCQAHCHFDTGSCQRCEPLGGPLLSCGVAPVNAQRPRSLDVASNGAELGMAWVSLAPNFTAEVHLARFDDSLSMLGQVGPLPASCPEEVALGAAADHWLLAIQSVDGIELLAVDDSGATLGGSLLTTAGEHPTVTMGPAGSALVTWFDSNVAYAALVSDLGVQQTPTVTLPFGMFLSAFPGAISPAYVGDGYLIAQRISSGGVNLARMELDGTASSTLVNVGNETEYPRLQASGSDVRLTFTDFSGGIGQSGPRWVRLDTNGQLIGPIVTLGATPDYFGATPHLIRNGESVVLLTGYTGISHSADSLDVQRLDAQGSFLTTPARFVTEPMRMTQFQVEQVGSAVVAAWINNAPPSLGYARLSP